MGVFVAEPEPLFTYETARQVEETFKQKPTRLPLEVPIRPIIIEPQPRNDLPLVIIGAVTIVGLVGLFLAYFLTKK